MSLAFSQFQLLIDDGFGVILVARFPVFLYQSLAVLLHIELAATPLRQDPLEVVAYGQHGLDNNIGGGIVGDNKEDKALAGSASLDRQDNIDVNEDICENGVVKKPK